MRGPQQWSDKVNQWNQRVIEEFRSNAGEVGGPAAGQRLALLTTLGARTGLERTTPMVCFEDGARLYVFASKDGADTHPDWFHNIRKEPSVFVEIRTTAFPALTRVLEEPARSSVFARAAEQFPRLTENAAMTSRVIPVVELVRDESVAPAR